MHIRIALGAFALFCSMTPAFARANDVCAMHVDLSPVGAVTTEKNHGPAPADEDFGLYRMSVLGIENTLRRDGDAIDEGSERALTTGPLACVVDSIRDWERAYPGDPWIPKDLMSLEVIYLRAHTPGAHALAVRTADWLAHDFPRSAFVTASRLALGRERPEVAEAPPAVPYRPAVARVNLPASPWDRFPPLESGR